MPAGNEIRLMNFQSQVKHDRIFLFGITGCSSNLGTAN